MLLSTIIFIVLFVILIIIGIKILKSVIKAVLSVVLLLLVVSVIFGFFVVQDANNFKTTFAQEKSLYVLSENDEIYTGFSALAFDFDTFKDESIQNIQEMMNNDSYSGKIILVSPQALNFNLSENSNSSLQDMLSNDDESLRAAAFKFALFNTISDEGPLFLLHHVRDGSIQILPRSLVIKTITFSPSFFFSSAKEKISSQTIKLTHMISFVGNSTNESMSNSDVNTTEVSS